MDYDTDTDREDLAASSAAVDRDINKYGLNKQEVCMSKDVEAANTGLSVPSRERKQLEEKDRPPESASRKRRIKRKCSADGTISHTPLDTFDIYALLPKKSHENIKGNPTRTSINTKKI